MIRLLLASLALALSACATMPRVAVPTPAQVAAADARLAEIERSYLAAKALAAPWLAWMPPEWRARVERAQAAVERALAAAREAVTLADRLAAISAAADAVAQLRFTAGS